MRRLSTLALLCLALYSIFSQVGAAPSGGVGGDNSNGELVDIKADLVFPHKVNDTLSVLCLVGNFAAQHNGAVITADSAVRYENDRLECFGNVLINKNTTYAYCDRVDYDSENNLATLYSRLVKVVDEDVTLYTYNFEFNTLDNIGRYWGNGLTMKLVAPEEGEELSDEPSYDVMESRRGYYYADNKSVIGVENVELKGAGYQMKGDSVIYDMQREKAHFFGATDIWNEDEDYIFGDAGVYNKMEQMYSVTENGYLLTADQEVWSDSMEYYRERQEAILRRNIQIIDTTNKSIAFSDYAQYWGAEERVFMTRDPLLINYDTQNPDQPVDSLYLRGDTIEVYSYALGTGPFFGSAAASKPEIPEGISELMTDSIEMFGGEEVAEEIVGEVTETDVDEVAEGEVEEEAEGGVVEEVAEAVIEEIAEIEVEEIAEEVVEEIAEEIVEEAAEAEVEAAAEAVSEKAAEVQKVEEKVGGEHPRNHERGQNQNRNIEQNHAHDHDHDHDHAHEATPAPMVSDSISNEGSIAPTKQELKEQKYAAQELARVTAIEAREYRKLEKRRDKVTERIEKRVEKGKSIYSDSMLLLRILAEIERRNEVADSVVMDSTEVVEEEVPAVVVADSLPDRDSLYRVFFAYGNVRAYRKDFQMVCDSMVANSYDTVMNLYIAPILWSDKNQVTAETMDFYTKDGDLDYADFFGNPIMASLVVPNDTMYINQVVGKEMRAFFVNNNVVRNDVTSNVQTIYFMQDEQTQEVNTIAFIESGSATFHIDNQQLDGIVYRQSPVYTFAPLDRRPTDVPLYLDNFKWEESLRPTRDSIMNRTMRPSEREAKSEMPRPTFPIQSKIDRDRERFERRKLWSDRIEQVSPDATEWMQSLGFTPGQPRPEGEGF